MYKAIANSIGENIKTGIVMMPVEGDKTLIKKIPFKSFLSMDYRHSSPNHLLQDKESIVANPTASMNERAPYVLGFIVVKNLNFVSELAGVSRATMTRLRNRILEDAVEVLSYNKVRQMRGSRAAFIEREPVELYKNPTDEMMTEMSWNIATVNAHEWQVIPFMVSTTVFFNNFRATIGVGNTDEDRKKIVFDLKHRLAEKMDELRDKTNKRLPQEITDSFFAGLFLVSPHRLMDESIYVNNLLDYIGESPEPVDVQNINESTGTPLDALPFMMPLPLDRSASPWKNGSVLFLSPDNNLTPYQPGSSDNSNES